MMSNLTEALEHEVESHDSAVILFLFGSCAIGALCRRVIQGLNLPLPYTVVLLVLGIMFGLLSDRFPAIRVYTRIVEMDPHLLLTVFLPVLIFESAFAMEVHTFIKTFIQVVLLAIPGLALAAFLTCLLSRYLFTYNWDWNIGMMFGSILSATDPVAVVALLRDLGASKQLAMVIEGESLLNDGAAIVFFNIFLKLATSEAGLTGGDIVLYFIQVALGGPLFGYAMAKISLFCLSRIFNDALAEITITLTAAYLTYYIGEEFLGVSGVLAVVVLGVAMSAERTMISPEVEHFLHMFWETLAYLANTLIFIIVGIVIAEKAISEIHGIDWFYMFALYFGSFVIRGLVIGIFSPFLRHTGYGMTWKEGIVMTWGGLRGAVGLALALQVAHSDRIDQDTVGVRVLIHVSGIVFLTLVVNATTIKRLLKLLGMSGLSPTKRMAMANSLRYIQEMREKTLNMLKSDRFLADADWELVEKQTEVPDPYKTTVEEESHEPVQFDDTFMSPAQLEDSLDIKHHAVCPECDTCLPPQYNKKELKDMTDEAILRMLKAEKMSYWRQFEQGMLSREATRKLQECSEVAADDKGKFIDVEEIKKSWEMPDWLETLKRVVKRIIGRKLAEIGKEDTLYPLYRFTRHIGFGIVIIIVVCIDIINIVFSIISQYVEDFYKIRSICHSINIGFLVIYILEVILKLTWQKKQYFKAVSHILALTIVCVGIVDVLISFLLPALLGEHDKVTVIVVSIFISFRAIRLLRLVEPLMPSVLNLVKRLMSQHLSYGFDVGRGFVAGEEEVRKLIEHMSDHKEIAKKMKQLSDNSRLDVIRCLGMLSKRHPDIALSIKTRQAIRSVLNILREGLHALMNDGILEEVEAEKLKKIVEEKMKRLQSAPPTLPVPPPDKMLRNVPWLRNDPELIDFIKDKAQLKSFNFEDVIINEGDPPGGIYIIVSGMVKLESRDPTGKLHNLQRVSSHHLPFKTYVLDFMTAGNIIGEMGLLTHRPRSATVIAETATQLLFISYEDMREAMEMFRDDDDPLEYRLWHVCANRIALNILMKQSSFQGWTKERVKLRLENSYLVDLDSTSFTVDSSMTDVVLVNGHAENPFTREKFEGPCYIPWTVFKLQMKPTDENIPVMLVVPSEAGQPIHGGKKGTEQQRGHGAFINSISQLCLRHASKHRTNVQSKWKKLQSAKTMGTLFDAHGQKASSTDSFPNGSPSDVHKLGGTVSTPGRLERGFLEKLRATQSNPADRETTGDDSPAADHHAETGSRHGIRRSSDTTVQRKTSSNWQFLKRAMSRSSDTVPEETSINFETIESLPDDVDYIEGGDIVPHIEDSSSTTDGRQSLSPVLEDEQTASPSASGSAAGDIVPHIEDSSSTKEGRQSLSHVLEDEQTASPSASGSAAGASKAGISDIELLQTKPDETEKSPPTITPVASDTHF